MPQALDHGRLVVRNDNGGDVHVHVAGLSSVDDNSLREAGQILSVGVSLVLVAIRRNRHCIPLLDSEGVRGVHLRAELGVGPLITGDTHVFPAEQSLQLLLKPYLNPQHFVHCAWNLKRRSLLRESGVACPERGVSRNLGRWTRSGT